MVTIIPVVYFFTRLASYVKNKWKVMVQFSSSRHIPRQKDTVHHVKPFQQQHFGLPDCSFSLELRAAFSLFDTNNSGQVLIKDIGKMMKQFFPEIHKSEIKDMMLILDKNGKNMNLQKAHNFVKKYTCIIPGASM